MRRVTMLLVAGSMLASACSAAEPVDAPTATIGGPSPSTSASAEPSATPSPIPTIPDVITEDYLLQVLTEMEATAAIFEDWLHNSEVGEKPTLEQQQPFFQVYVPEAATKIIHDLIDNRDRGDQFEDAADPYGPYEPVSVNIHREDPACPWFDVVWDSSKAIKPGGDERSPQTIGLVQASDHGVSNTTGWLYRSVIATAKLTEDSIPNELEERTLCAG